jgi:cysteine desulfurase
VIPRAGAWVYLDWNATTPPLPEVLAAMQAAAAAAWANPASVHGPGRRARAEVERAREALAALLDAPFEARDIVLTSGGTEANNLAIHHAFSEGAPGALVTSRLEHPSVVRAAEALAARGVTVAWAAPASTGQVTPESVAEAMDRAGRQAPVRLVSLQAVNHETGVIQPVEAVAELAHARRALLHVDAVQAVGRLPPSAWSGADLVSVAAHKIRGPKGIGAIATRPGVRLRPLLVGGAQERGLRPGTQDAAAAAGFGVAAERARDGGPARYARVRPLRDLLESELMRVGGRFGPAPVRNGEGARAPHVTNLSFPGLRGDELCAALDLEGVAVSSGAACSAGTAEPSPVLLAMVGAARASSAVRASLGEESSEAQVVTAVACLERVLARSAPRHRCAHER